MVWIKTVRTYNSNITCKASQWEWIQLSGWKEELCMGSNVQRANCSVSHYLVKANAFLSSVRGLEPPCQKSATSNGIFICCENFWILHKPYLILSLCVWITVRNKSFQYTRMETSQWEKLTKASGKKKHEIKRKEKKETGCSITSRYSSLLIRLNILFFRVRHTLACHGEQPIVSLGLLLNPFLIVRPSMICKSLNGSSCSGLRAITAADVTMASVWCTQLGDSFISSQTSPGWWSIRSFPSGDRDITAYEGAFKDDSLRQ